MLDIVITTTDKKDVVIADQMARIKNQAILGNIGHFDNELGSACQVIAQIALSLSKHQEYDNEIYRLVLKLDEKVAPYSRAGAWRAADKLTK
jgi:S-adenosylhomocysteine hydrolase